MKLQLFCLLSLTFVVGIIKTWFNASLLHFAYFNTQYLPVTHLLDMLTACLLLAQILPINVKFLCTWHPHLLEYLHQCFQLLLNSLLMAACCVSIDFTYTLQAFHKTDWALSIVVCWGMCWNSWTETNSYQGRILEGWGCHFFFLFWKPKIFSVTEIKQVASLLYVWKDGDWCSKVSHVKDPQILNVWSRREGGSETSQGLCHLIHLFYWWPSVAVINRS